MNRSQVNNWLNRRNKISYHHAINIAFITKISLERLAPFNPTNKIIQLLDRTSPLLEIPIKNVFVKNLYCFQEIYEDRLIIIDTDGVLISGVTKFEAYKASGYKFIPVALFDLDAPLSVRTIESIKFHFLIIERSIIGSHLEQIVGNRQGQRNDLVKPQEHDKENDQNNLSLRSMLNEVRGRKDQEIAKLLGFNSIGTCHSVKQVCLHGIPELMRALDYHQLSVAKANKFAKLPSEQQLAFIQLRNQEKERV